MVPKTLSLASARSLALSRFVDAFLFHFTGLEEQDALPEFPTMNQQGGSFCFELMSHESQASNTPSQESLSRKAHDNLSSGGGSRDKSAGSGRSEDDNWIAMLM
jgi:hypothetical protein